MQLNSMLKQMILMVHLDYLNSWIKNNKINYIQLCYN